MKIIIGLIGEQGSGKGTFVEILRELLPSMKIGHHKSSGIIKKTLELWSIPFNRENAQKLPVIMEKHFGKGILSQAIKPIIENDDSDIVIFDGVRWSSDYQMIRSLFNPGICAYRLVYVTARAKIRFSRIKNRNEKFGESEITWKQFLRQESASTEKDIPLLWGKDSKITNNGTRKKFKKSIIAFLRRCYYLFPINIQESLFLK